MYTRLVTQPAARFVVIGLLIALTSAMLIVPRAASQGTDSLAVDIVFTEESFEVAPAFGTPLEIEEFTYRGDVLSGQGAVYAAGDAGGERIGTFYFMGTATAEPEHFEAAANHLYAQGYFELFGEGTLAITGAINFISPYTVTITGGTGSYVAAGGQCTTAQIEGGETWTCELH